MLHATSTKTFIMIQFNNFSYFVVFSPFKTVNLQFYHNFKTLEYSWILLHERLFTQKAFDDTYIMPSVYQIDFKRL